MGGSQKKDQRIYVAHDFEVDTKCQLYMDEPSAITYWSLSFNQNLDFLRKFGGLKVEIDSEFKRLLCINEKDLQEMLDKGRIERYSHQIKKSNKYECADGCDCRCGCGASRYPRVGDIEKYTTRDKYSEKYVSVNVKIIYRSPDHTSKQNLSLDNQNLP